MGTQLVRIAAEVGFSETAFAAPLPTPATPVDEQAAEQSGPLAADKKIRASAAWQVGDWY